MTNDALEQLLPAEAYRAADWFAREERALFSRCWTFAGLESDLPAPGRYLTVRCGRTSLVVLRDRDGALRAFHNLCRHRGTELLEGCGELGRAIVCPYHNWSYGLDGALLGAPQQEACFPGLDKSGLGLHPAAVATLKGLIFVHPEAAPAEPFEAWLASLPEVLWPHDPAALSEEPELLYETRCNWKVFYENAIDGYHLAYLHKKTLGGPTAGENLWECHGRHLVWYATEDGGKSALPAAVAKAMSGSGEIEGAESGAYGGVFMLYPATIVTASPYDLAVTSIEPLGPETTRLRVRSWARPSGGIFGGGARRGRTAGAEPIRLDRLKEHPKESGDFTLEDLWICEKIQRSLRSPRFQVGALARGPGGEAPLVWFQRQVLDDVGGVDGSSFQSIQRDR